jgi:hypothetical protein
VATGFVEIAVHAVQQLVLFCSLDQDCKMNTREKTEASLYVSQVFEGIYEDIELDNQQGKQ